LISPFGCRRSGAGGGCGLLVPDSKCWGTGCRPQLSIISSDIGSSPWQPLDFNHLPVDLFLVGTTLFLVGTKNNFYPVDMFLVGTKNNFYPRDLFLVGTTLFLVGTEMLPMGTEIFLVGTDLFLLGTSLFLVGTTLLVVYNKLCKFDRRQKGAYTPVFRKIYK